MILLILGLALWAGAHFWKRIAPDHRAGFGDRGKMIVAVASVIAIVLMVVGYRSADCAVYWGRSPAMTGINNLLILFSFYLFAASGKKTRITRWIRHPQLTAVAVWAVAHLLVNGDVPSFVLFGGLLIWALAEMVVLNRAQGARGAYHAPPIKSEWIAIVAAVVLYIVVAGIHAWLGYNPFG
ncbi:NnrU family protein [Loktanella sp. SALINAS62]|uniref:NnrU family protein n=1 Tax=Loktanella sp. SALINAS62 TaxID=2706124 RepID=UPI001B8BED57|nr:NnrU family protein [Loktanella sp. SALINAS62]MBS1302531.1 NnrU family protein [Loktanella sp. SALINAS62]